jgi:hypothetical protein
MTTGLVGGEISMLSIADVVVEVITAPGGGLNVLVLETDFFFEAVLVFFLLLVGTAAAAAAVVFFLRFVGLLVVAVAAMDTADALRFFCGVGFGFGFVVAVALLATADAVAAACC